MNVDRSRLQRYGKLIVQLVIYENNVTFWRHVKYIHILYKNLCTKFQHLYTFLNALFISLPQWCILISHEFMVAVEIVFKIHYVDTKYFSCLYYIVNVKAEFFVIQLIKQHAPKKY
jgi:hypothetical protein